MKEKTAAAHVETALFVHPTVREMTLVALVCAAAVVLSVSLYDRCVPLMDEAMFADPAANLFFGHSFSSTAWAFQGRGEFFAGNAPLYSVLLYHSMWAFGFGLLSVRAVNYIPVVAAVLLIWLGAVRFHLVHRPVWRVALVVVLLAGYGMVYSYWRVRYDCLTLLVAAAAFVAWSIRLPWLRYACLTLVGLFIPLSGVQLIPLAGVFAILLWFVIGKEVFRSFAVMALGCTAGLVFLYVLWSTNGVWMKFVYSTLGSRHVLTGQVAQAAVQGDLGGILRFLSLPTIYVADWSFTALLAAMLLLAFWRLRSGIRSLRTHETFGVAVALAVPLGLFLAGKYPLYYSWMAYVPVAVCLCASASADQCRRAKLVAATAVILGTIVGMPAYVTRVVNYTAGLNYRTMEEVVRAQLQPGDWVYCNFVAYFVCREWAEVVFVPTFANSRLVPGLPERDRIMALVVHPDELGKATQRVGGTWREVGRVPVDYVAAETPAGGIAVKRIYAVRVYRRDS